jgi:LysM repeat protein
MAGKKISVFIMVVTFHLVVMGVIYLSTRPDTPVKDEAQISEDLPKAVSQKPKVIRNTTPTPLPKPPVVDKYTIHIVASGDFLGKIASKYKISSKTIMALNGIKDPNKIHLGQKLKIPLK